MASGVGGDKNDAGVAARLVQGEYRRLADGIIGGVDAQEGATYIREILIAPRKILVLLSSARAVEDRTSAAARITDGGGGGGSQE